MQEPTKSFGMGVNVPAVPTMPPEPITGPQPGKYLGRIVVEVWALDDPSRGDGLALDVQRTGTKDIRVIDEFLHETIARLHARLQRQQRLR